MRKEFCFHFPFTTMCQRLLKGGDVNDFVDTSFTITHLVGREGWHVSVRRQCDVADQALLRVYGFPDICNKLTHYQFHIHGMHSGVHRMGLPISNFLCFLCSKFYSSHYAFLLQMWNRIPFALHRRVVSGVNCTKSLGRYRTLP